MKATGWVLGAAIAASTVIAPSAARADPPPPQQGADDQHFKVDPVADGVLIAAGAGTGGLLELILSTGEIAPQRPGNTANLLSFDRVAITQTIDTSAGTVSTIGLGLALSFAVFDPIASGFRDGWDAALVDGTMYAESLALTMALTDITKIAVRRPRPIAYIEQAQLDAQYGGPDKSPSISNTDATLSFFSGHAALTAAASATATYLAFSRAPGSPRAWITLVAGTLLTGFVSYERVRAGAHFPTDVIGGALAGASIGVLVPHLHHRDEERPRVWIGGAPAPVGGGGTVVVQGSF